MTWLSALRSSPGPQSKQEYLYLYLKGFSMGIADLIPGISGGTVAFIFGIYRDFLNALQSLGGATLKSLLGLQFQESLRRVHFRFLLCLGLGMLTSLISLAPLVDFFLKNYPVHLWSFFAGLIVASIPFLLFRVEKPWGGKVILCFFMGVLGGYFFTGIIPLETPDNLFFISFMGFVAITAMILPGISGSFLLLILGKYQFLITALKNPFSHILEIFVFAMGGVVSLLSVSRFLNKIFKKYPALMSFFFSGFLIGSLRKVWPWKREIQFLFIGGKKKVLEAQNILPSDLFEVGVALGVFLFGIVLIVLLEYGARAREQKSNASSL